MKTTKEIIEVMQAFERGEQIEIFLKGHWVEHKNPYWDWYNFDYRVKPTTIKKYMCSLRKRKSFLAAQRAHGSEVKVKSVDNSGFYARTGENNVELSAFVNADGCVALTAKSYRTTIVCELLGLEVEFADGTPCGKEVEE